MNPNRFRRDVPEVPISQKDFFKFQAGGEVTIQVTAGNFLRMGDILACRLGLSESLCEVVRVSLSTNFTKDSVVVTKVRKE